MDSDQFFIDLEFIEDGRTIDPISIGIVRESDGAEYYAISTEFNPRKADQWVRDNVLAALPERFPVPPYPGGGSPNYAERLRRAHAWKSRERIAIEVLALLRGKSLKEADELGRLARSRFTLWIDRLFGHGSLEHHPRPEIQDLFNDSWSAPNPRIWAEWGAYDWVCFCQLFGRMVDLPRSLPMRVRDIIQYSEDFLGFPSEELPDSLEVDGNHNALLGARTVKMRYDWLKRQETFEPPTELEIRFTEPSDYGKPNQEG